MFLSLPPCQVTGTVMESPYQIYSCKTGFHIYSSQAKFHFPQTFTSVFLRWHLPLTSTIWLLVSDDPISHSNSQHALLPDFFFLPHTMPTSYTVTPSTTPLSLYNHRKLSNLKQHLFTISAGGSLGLADLCPVLRVSQGWNPGVSGLHFFLDLGALFQSPRAVDCIGLGVAMGQGPGFLAGCPRVAAPQVLALAPLRLSHNIMTPFPRPAGDLPSVLSSQGWHPSPSPYSVS